MVPKNSLVNVLWFDQLTLIKEAAKYP
ncbi:hypothetical protein VCHENC02_2617A, partial [Vibrio harveyi]